MRAIALAAIVPLLLPCEASAQQLRGEGRYANLGYAFTPWQQTPWNGIEYRAKCEGEQVQGSNTGPIKWMVQYRNRARKPVHFDYLIQSPAPANQTAASGRADVLPGKTIHRLGIVRTTRCDEGMVTVVGNVRFGDDLNGTPYAPQDSAP